MTQTTAPLATQTPGPNSAEVEQHLRRAAQAHPDHVDLRVVEHTNQGRPIFAVTLTDPAVPAEQKQHVLIVAGQHGNEESARAVAIALIDHLLKQSAADILKNQSIVVMPNLNPDGAEQDLYATPDGVKPNLDHGRDGPTTPEGRAFERVAEQCNPDVYVDMHARGHAGCSYDMVLYPQTKSYTEDDNLFHRLAADMARAGERAGLPHITHPLAWWVPPPDDACSSTAYAYRRYKSIVMLTESTEDNDHAYPRELTLKVGLARLMALLDVGQRRDPRLYYPGYPNALVLGMPWTAVVAAGTTAAARRASRVAIWRQRDAFDTVHAGLPELPHQKHKTIDYCGQPIDGPVGFMFRATGRLRVTAARCAGQALQLSETDGYYTYHDDISTFAVIVLPRLERGLYEFEVELAPQTDAGG